jgi:CubicO group peptidase (beta-lactamase class C family)
MKKSILFLLLLFIKPYGLFSQGEKKPIEPSDIRVNSQHKPATTYGVTKPVNSQNFDIDSIITDLRKFIPKFLKDRNVPGFGISLVSNGQVVFTDGFGCANSITKVPVTANTLFEVASISKVFTAYIALRLVDEGKLSLNKSLFSYLSKEWMPYSIYQDSIKLNHVLSHSSGLNKITREIMFKPGFAYFYSANGFNLVKDVMEEVTGETLEELAQRLVFQPLGMKNSSFVLKDELLPVTANGHIHAIVPVVLFGAMFLVLYFIIYLVGLLISRLLTKSWKLRTIHITVFIILSSVIVVCTLFILLGKSSLGEFATITVIAGLTALIVFLILLFFSRLLIRRFVHKKVYQRIFYSFTGLLFIVIILFISMKVINLPVPSRSDYKPSAAGTLRTAPGELALFMIEIANPKFLKAETAELLRTPQIKLDENLSWGMGPGIFYSEQGYALWQWGQHIDFQSIMIVYPESNSGVVICTNNDLLNPDVALEIAQHILGGNLESIRSAIHLRYDYRK